MATDMPAPHLPSKKRRPSIDDNIEKGAHGTDEVPGKASIDESRLPTKKRRASSYEEIPEHRNSHESSDRKTSFDITPRGRLMSFDIHDPNLRKGSLDVSIDDFNILRARSFSKEFHHNPRKFSGESFKLDSLGSVQHEEDEDDDKTAKMRGNSFVNAIDHLNALGRRKDDDHSHESLSSAGQRMLMESYMQGSHSSGRDRAESFRGRDRFESWGGMSDISFGHVLETAAATHDDRKPSAVPSGISCDRERLYSFDRERLDSLASLSELYGSNLDTSNMEAILAATVAQVGDQLADIVTGLDASVASGDDSAIIFARHQRHRQGSIGSASEIMPIIGASSDRSRRPRSWSTNSQLGVDYDAVVAAVDAAQAATGGIDFDNIESTSHAENAKAARASRRQLHLPVKRKQVSESTKKDIRNKARKQALTSGYIPPRKDSDGSGKAPLKKRAKRDSPESEKKAHTPKTPLAKAQPTSSRSSGPKPSDEKWDSMYECLLKYVEERKQEESKGLSIEERDAWEWDGNVPTNYKTQDGLPLGRWINNQRSAYAKGRLKSDREERLLDAGLKWSVLTSNSWNLMFNELKKYIAQQEEGGAPWDGNVPTNFEIKVQDEIENDGKDKKLGRWVNRQRSLYQTNKLRKDRQDMLEDIGLKWSMLSTNSWETMFESLKDYAEDAKKENGSWDGHIAVHYRTKDTSRPLGRWVNRQRHAHERGKLKQEQVDMLTQIGLVMDVQDNDDGGEHDADDYDVMEQIII